MNSDDFLAVVFQAAEYLQPLIELNTAAYTDKVDLNGAPYHDHPLRVSSIIAQQGPKFVGAGIPFDRVTDAIAVGLTHDLIEDFGGKYVLVLKDHLTPDAFEALQAISRRDGESYKNYLSRVGESPLATIVKMADLMDNLRPDRLPHPMTKKAADRVDRYTKAYAYLVKALRVTQGKLSGLGGSSSIH